MRNKLLTIGAAGAIAFLLATNPVVSDAAGKISGSQIKNNSITGKKIKDASLTTADFGGSVPAGPAGPTGPAGPAGTPGTAGAPAFVTAYNLSSTNFSSGVTTGYTFAGTPATVTLTANQSFLISGSLDLSSSTDNDARIDWCYQPAAGGTVTAAGFGQQIRAYPNQETGAFSGFASLGAGSYKIGACIETIATGQSPFGSDYVHGFVAVVNGAGPAPARTTGPTSKPGL